MVGSLFVYPAGELVELASGVERFGSFNDYWSMALSYGIVASFLSLPNLALLFLIRPYLKKRFRFEHQFDITLALTLAGVWIGTYGIDTNLDAAIAYSIGGLITILVLRSDPFKRRLETLTI